MTDQRQDSQPVFSEVLASIAHDMKNSLGMVLSTIDEIIDACGPAACPSSARLAQLQYEAKRVNNNLIQLLTLYKLEAGRYMVNVTFNDVADFLEENVLQHQPLLEAKGIAIETACGEGLEWFFDRYLVSGVVNNVLNNAYRYAKERIALSASVEEGRFCITIEDDGPGYPDHMLASGSSIRNQPGYYAGSTGLGLFFASLVADLHENRGTQGSIVTENGGSLGGSRFRIFLP